MIKKIKKGDLLVYPAHGLVKVKDLQDKTINAKPTKVLLLEVLSNGMLILVPATETARVGLRSLVTKDAARRVLDFISDGGAVGSDKPWNARYREYMELIKTGNLNEIAQVYINLKDHRLEGGLSFGERKMLDHAKELIVGELSKVLDRSPDQVEEEIAAGAA